MFFTPFDTSEDDMFLKEVTLINLSKTILFCFCFHFNDFRYQNEIYVILIFLSILPVYKSNTVFA